MPVSKPFLINVWRVGKRIEVDMIEAFAYLAVIFLSGAALLKTVREKALSDWDLQRWRSSMLLLFILVASVNFVVATQMNETTLIVARGVLGIAWGSIALVPCRIKVVRAHRILYIPRNLLFAGVGFVVFLRASVDIGCGWAIALISW